MKPLFEGDEFREALAGFDTVATHVRVIHGIPVLFTADGRLIEGQMDTSLHSDLGQSVYAIIKLRVEPPPE